MGPRRAEVIRRFVGGASYKEIAYDMGISYSTVRQHAMHFLHRHGARLTHRGGANRALCIAIMKDGAK